MLKREEKPRVYISNYNTAQIFEQLIRREIVTGKTLIEYKRALRAFYQRSYDSRNRLQRLFDGEYVRIASNDGESYRDLYLTNVPYTDDELNQIYYDNQMYSPYDCTGHVFMSDIDQIYLKFKDKYLIVERWGLDI